MPILLSICEAELEEVCGHEREQHQTRRQFLIHSPLQTNEKFLGNTGWWCQRKLHPSEASEITPHMNVFAISRKNIKVINQLRCQFSNLNDNIDQYLQRETGRGEWS